MIKNLKTLRNQRGISQKALADIIMVSQQSINKYENHNVEPDIETLIKIADYFQVSLDYLVGRNFNSAILTKSDINMSREELLLAKNALDKLIKLIDKCD